MKSVYTLGKCDYNNVGRKNHKATIEWELKEGKFSMSGSIWNTKETDCVCGGQCIAEIVKYFPKDKKAKRMSQIWERWHLNDLQAGCEHQREAQRKGFMPKKYEKILEQKKTYCPVCDYFYGSAWLKEEIPANISREIQSWAFDTN